jgi:hypothetical protein
MVKKTEKGDDVTRFWYTLKNLDPFLIEKHHKTQQWTKKNSRWLRIQPKEAS